MGRFGYSARSEAFGWRDFAFAKLAVVTCRDLLRRMRSQYKFVITAGLFVTCLLPRR